jgi:hypothetical protein
MPLLLRFHTSNTAKLVKAGLIRYQFRERGYVHLKLFHASE